MSVTIDLPQCQEQPRGGGGPKKCQSEAPAPPPQMSMTTDLPQCQEQRGGGGGDPPAQQNVSLRGAGVDLPECQGQAQGTKKSVFFFW